MKKIEFIKAYKALSEEQRKVYESSGYYKINGQHYGVSATLSLAMDGYEGGFFVPFSWVRKQKKYDWKGAKIAFIRYPTIVKEEENGHSRNVFKGWRGGKVVNIKYLKKEGENVEREEVEKEFSLSSK